MAAIDYPTHLATMWQRAMAPRNLVAPTVISTFAGGGGSTTGYLMAGYNELLAVEWDDNAVETLRRNYPHLDIYHGDIAKLTVAEVLRRTGLAVGELDVLDGSPPCQGFSMGGNRILDDPRNQLFQEYVRLLRGLRPRVFVMENVSGMVQGKMKLAFVEILRALKASGYHVSAKRLNAMYFHVPQSRERLIFIGVREDLGIAPSHPPAESFPIPTHAAIKQYEDYPPDREMKAWLKELCPQIRATHNSKQRRIIFKRHKGTSGSAISTRRLAYDKPSPTISKSEIAASGLLHPTKDRYLTMPELKRLGSFPDEYQFTDRMNACKRIGNSVPPLFMEAIARHIRTHILNQVANMEPASP